MKSKFLKRLLVIIILAIAITIIYNVVKDKLDIRNLEKQQIVQESEKQEEQIINEEQENTNKYENEIFGEFYNEAEKILENMTLEEKVGQMFLARYPESGVIEEIENENPGGYILFARDFKEHNKQTILTELTECQENSKIKLILGVDEEGGTVTRVSLYKAFRNSKFLSPQDLWKQGGLDAIIQDSIEKSNLLKSIGLNMNLAPVADLPTEKSSFIYKRSYGKNAEETATYVSKLVNQMNQDGMIATLKHFPGYGDNVDTHTGIAIDKREYSNFEKSDFIPFKAGIEANVPTILVNHNIVECMDSNKPASLSENVHEILREDLEFSGLIITDDLAMEAVSEYVENGEAAVQAVLAGNDMIISSDFVTQKNEIIRAVKNGDISEEIINKAVRRILACKYYYKIES